MTDAEAAAILSDWLRLDYEFAFEGNRDKRIAIERAIVLLETGHRCVCHYGEHADG